MEVPVDGSHHWHFFVPRTERTLPDACLECDPSVNNTEYGKNFKLQRVSFPVQLMLLDRYRRCHHLVLLLRRNR